MKYLLDAFDGRPLVKVGDRNFLVNPLVDQEPATTYELMEDAVIELSKLTDFHKANKILGEEDRGGFIAALLAYSHKIPLAMVKWNPSELLGKIPINFRNAYTSGKMYVNGLEKGDRVIIVEDLIDSGGTIIAMINLLREYAVEIMDVIAVAEKSEYLGVNRIEEETGYKVKHLLKFSSIGTHSKVVWINEVAR